MNAIAWQHFLLNEDTDQVIQHVQKAMEIDGRNAYVVGTYGCLLLQKGDLPAAKENLKEAAERHAAERHKTASATNLYYVSLVQFRSGEKEQG